MLARKFAHIAMLALALLVAPKVAQADDDGDPTTLRAQGADYVYTGTTGTSSTTSRDGDTLTVTTSVTTVGVYEYNDGTCQVQVYESTDTTIVNFETGSVFRDYGDAKITFDSGRIPKDGGDEDLEDEELDDDGNASD